MRLEHLLSREVLVRLVYRAATVKGILIPGWFRLLSLVLIFWGMLFSVCHYNIRCSLIAQLVRALH